MQAKKIAIVPAYSKMAQPTETDYAKKILWLTWFLQFLYVVGIHKKIEFLTSGAVLGPILLAPAACIMLAKTWRSAAKFGLYCSLVVPGCVGFLLLLISLLSFAKKHDGLNLLKHILQTIEPTLLVWAMLMLVTLPALITGAGAKAIWQYFRKEKELNRS